MKFRVVIRDSLMFPYQIQRCVKFLWFLEIWANIDEINGIHNSLEQAKDEICRLIQQKRKLQTKKIQSGKLIGEPGNIVFEYDDSDLIVDKLKGK